MKTWLVIVSVVAVLLVASVGVGFWMLTETKAELTDARAELAEIQEGIEGNFGYWPEATTEGPFPWWGYAEKEPEYWWEQETSEGKYPWCEGIEVTISDLEQRVEELEGTVDDLEWQLWGLEYTLRQYSID